MVSDTKQEYNYRSGMKTKNPGLEMVSKHFLQCRGLVSDHKFLLTSLQMLKLSQQGRHVTAICSQLCALRQFSLTVLRQCQWRH